MFYYMLILLLWLLVILVMASQVILPMLSDYKFFWIIPYMKIRSKYKNKLNSISTKQMEQELKEAIKYKEK